MERLVNLHIKRLPEGVYLATSDDVQGLVVRGRTIQETLEIARDVARKLIELQSGGEPGEGLQFVQDKFDYPLVVGA